MKAIIKEAQQQLMPKMALGFLKEGNKRFVNDLKEDCNLLEQTQETTNR